MVYSHTDKTLQTFGRMTDYTWECITGCPTLIPLTNLVHVFFTSVNKTFNSVIWEAGDETFTNRFTSTTSDDIELG